MNGKGKAPTHIEAAACRCSKSDCTTKVRNPFQKTKDLSRVLQYFHYEVGTSLDCALSTGILRNSITWYICDLERLGLLQAIKKDKDKTTGFRAKYYSADQTLWCKPTFTQLNIWEELP